ncbi:MAG: YfhO family protein [Clostridia bacterium]|nr:YfhO family protein [Clostridia bacterium]
MHTLRSQEKKNKYQVLRYCFFSGLWALIIISAVYFMHSNSLYTLFGYDSTVLRMDLYHQYGPLVAEVYDRVVQGKTLLYSFTSGLGGGFLGNFFNYCSSPFTYVVLLTGHKNMPEAIALIILLKAILSSVAFTYFINKSGRKPSVFSIAFGLMYTFSGYFIAYSWNIMWLDAMCVFPLVMLGIEKIIDKKRPILYICALWYTMVTNYYMAYMVCILSVIYFLFYYFSNYDFLATLRKAVDEKKNVTAEDPYAAHGLVVKEDNVERIPLETMEMLSLQENPEAVPAAEDATEDVIQPQNAEPFFSELVEERVVEKMEDETPAPTPIPLKIETGFSLRNSRFFASGFTFALSSFLAFALACFSLLPVIFTLQSSSATSSNAPETISYYFNIFDFIANHLPSVETTIRSSGNNVIPNVYCGLLTLLLLPFFFLSDRIKGKKKVCAFLVLVLFYFSFNVNKLNFVWHGLHFPNDLPYRFSFAYSFFLLILAYEAITHLDAVPRKFYVVSGFGICAFVMLVSKLGVQNVSRYSMILAVVMAVVYVIGLGLMRSDRYESKTVARILVFLVVVELLFGNTPRYVMSQKKSDYTGDYDAYRSIVAEVEENEEELFYRTELSKLRARMDPCWYGYHGVSTFSSMAYERTSNVMKSLGLFGNNINSYTYYPQTPIFNSFFSLRYVYDNRSLLSESDTYDRVAANDKFTAYKYEYFLPLAFSVDGDIENWITTNSNPFEVQNSLLERSVGIDDVMVKVRATDFTQTNLDSVSLFNINAGALFYVSKNESGKPASLETYVDVDEDGHYYVHAGSSGISDIIVKAGEEKDPAFSYRYTSTSVAPFILDLGELKKGDRISVAYTLTESNSGTNIYFSCAKLDGAEFETAYQKILDNGTLKLDSFTESHFTGTINVTNENAVLFTSIPYDESWKIYVDGELVKYDHTNAAPKKIFGLTLGKTDNTEGDAFAIGNAFIGVKIGQGEHTVEFDYQPNGLEKGIKISLVALVIAIILLVFKFAVKMPRWKKNKNNLALFCEPDTDEEPIEPELKIETTDGMPEPDGSDPE